jgi:hypothetical protein
MQRLFFSAKPVLAVALAVGTLAAASGAHAGMLTDAAVSLQVQAPAHHVQPAPVVVQPAPVRVQPAPVLVQPAPVRVRPAPVIVQPAPVYVRPAPVYVQQHPKSKSHGAWGDADHDGVPNRYDRDSRHYDGHAAHRAGWTDADRDGVPNRYDRAPNNPYRR